MMCVCVCVYLPPPLCGEEGVCGEGEEDALSKHDEGEHTTTTHTGMGDEKEEERR